MLGMVIQSLSRRPDGLRSLQSDMAAPERPLHPRAATLRTESILPPLNDRLVNAGNQPFTVGTICVDDYTVMAFFCVFNDLVSEKRNERLREIEDVESNSFVPPDRIARAEILTVYPSLRITSSTRRRVSGLILPVSFSTLETVLMETFASRATSLIRYAVSHCSNPFLLIT